MRTAMIRPCDTCPFRTDVKPFIRSGRAQEIALSLLQDEAFPCHKTLDYEEEEFDEDGHALPYVYQGTEQHCAGAMIMLMHMQRPNQWMRIAERMGWLNLDKLDMNAPVDRHTRGFLARHQGQK